MEKGFTFNFDQLKKVEDAVALAEELVSNYFKMSSVQWLRTRYDVKTAKDLEQIEIIDGPFAQVLGYEAQRKDSSLGSSAFTCYKVCFQDATIINFLKINKNILFFPFLLYIAVHELVHIVRFSTFQQIYTATSEVECAIKEEQKVDSLTWEILSGISIPGVDKVFRYYNNRVLKELNKK